MDGAPGLDDKEWLSGESKEEQERYDADTDAMDKENGDASLLLDL